VIRTGVFCFFALLVSALVPAAQVLSETTGLSVARGFTVERIAGIDGARELAALPNGDLIVGTKSDTVYAIPSAEGRAGAPRVFAHLDDDRAAGVAFIPQRSEIVVATEHHVYAIPYRGTLEGAAPRRIADVRTGPIAPGSDGDVHTTTSVAFAGATLYAAAGSSCNATMDGKPCVEVDPTRAAVSIVLANGTLRQRARRVRNAIALAVNPQTGSLWIGDAGQDDLPFGHPYEFLDDLSSHQGIADYGWPYCEENRHAYVAGARCANTVEPLVELPAYSTIIGAAFYPQRQSGPYAFPAAYRGTLFAAAHGSWHTDAQGCFAAPPRVVAIAMHGDRPAIPVDWQNPTRQWTDFLWGFQSECRTRIGRPTGIAVGPKGSLFVADDTAGAVYRIRPVR
jgi:glucose/arabinose dehydrogenase